MFDTSRKIALATSVSLFAVLALPALASNSDGISELTVSTSYDAAQDTNAAEVVPDIADDIRKAIADRVPGSDNAADPIMRVSIKKVALNGDTILPASAEFNELSGVVAIETNTGEGGVTLPINILASTDLGAVPDGYVGIAPSLDDFYSAMVEAFADQVVVAYEAKNEVGGRISD